MDREKVIKGLEAIVNDDWMWKKADYYAGICKDAIALLKAQEPIEPIQGKDNDGDDIFCCGSCGAVVGDNLLDASGEYELRFNYCPECGQAVKWE